MKRTMVAMVLLSVFLPMPAMAQADSEQPTADLMLADGYMEVHNELIVIDGTIPLISMTRDPEHLKWVKDGGVTVASVSVSGPPKDPELTTDIVSWFSEQIQTNDDYVLIQNTDDILQQEKKTSSESSTIARALSPSRRIWIASG